MDPIYQRKCREWLLEHVRNGGTFSSALTYLKWLRECDRMAIINDGSRCLLPAQLRGLKQNAEETLEAVFIRLVGKSTEDVEKLFEQEANEEE